MDDAGNYICEVENEAEPIKQTNTLQILGELEKLFNIFSFWYVLQNTNTAFVVLCQTILCIEKLDLYLSTMGSNGGTLLVKLSTNPSHVSTIKDKTLLECSNDNEAFIWTNFWNTIKLRGWN